MPLLTGTFLGLYLWPRYSELIIFTCKVWKQGDADHRRLGFREVHGPGLCVLWGLSVGLGSEKEKRQATCKNGGVRSGLQSEWVSG